MAATMGVNACHIDCSFPVAEGEAGLRAAIERVRREAEENVRRLLVGKRVVKRIYVPGRLVNFVVATGP